MKWNLAKKIVIWSKKLNWKGKENWAKRTKNINWAMSMKINDNWIEIFQNEGCDKEKVRSLKWAINMWIMSLTWT